MVLLLDVLAFALFVALALVTYRLWREKKRTEQWLSRALAASVFLLAIFLFHRMLHETIAAASDDRGARPAASAARGHDTMEKLGCGDCHSVGGGVVVGPDLKNAASKFDRDTLVKWIEDPDAIYAARHRHPLNSGFSEMPNLGVNEHDAEDIADYLTTVADSDH